MMSCCVGNLRLALLFLPLYFRHAISFRKFPRPKMASIINFRPCDSVGSQWR